MIGSRSTTVSDAKRRRFRLLQGFGSGAGGVGPVGRAMLRVGGVGPPDVTDGEER